MFINQKLLASTIIIFFALFFVSTQEVQASNIFIFNKNLSVGVTSNDVKELQKFLNNKGFAVAESGPGSLGRETSFFGLATRNALIKFQKSNKITPASGYFGLLSRGKINRILKSVTIIHSPETNQETKKQTISQVNETNKNKEYYYVGGSITGITDEVILQNNNKDDLIIGLNQNNAFTFSTMIADGSSYNVNVKSKHHDQTCYTNNNNGVIVGADIKNVKIACATNSLYNPFTYVPSNNAALYSLLYTAGSGGMISGVASQTVSHGGNGSTVIATPNEGYSFVSWSDGYLTAQRTDSAVTASKSITANFEINTVAPSALSYNSPNIFVVDTAISTLFPTVTGVVDSYSISPNLPASLSFNTSNGQITGTPTASTTPSTYTITATNASGSTTFEIVIMVYGTVIGANGKIWLDRNLGAKQVAASSTDYLAYGDLFQWGRSADGHQIRSSNATSTISSSDNSGHDNFILGTSSPFDWRSPQNNNLWQDEVSINNPCPSGFRLPTETEWLAEKASWSFSNSFGAFTSPLKLTLAGYRLNNNGDLSGVDSYGIYWSNVIGNTLSRSFIFTNIAANMSANYRAYGFSVRCTANSYSISYNGNNNTSGTVPANQTKIYDTTLILANNSGTLQKNSYTFSGWNTAADGTGIDYAIGANYTSNVSITLYAKWTPMLAIGDSYQGGKIAYIFKEGDSGYVAGETHGLIAATADQSTGIIWAKSAYQSTYVPSSTLAAIGNGAANTDKIIAQNGSGNTYAAGLARACTDGGYNDWYLPSRDELTTLYDNRIAIGGFEAAYYWSSFEGGANSAWSKHFLAASWSNQLKSTQWTYVRAVRSF